MKFYHESVGECVNQVYEINADTWEDAKKRLSMIWPLGTILQCVMKMR